MILPDLYINFPNSTTSSRLEYLYFGDNHFEGKIIVPIAKLINLKELDLSFLNTSYPIDILEKLELVELSDNRIKGKVPEWLWNLPCLNTVFLKNNLFDGFKGPADVLSLEILELGYNNLTRPIPQCLSNLIVVKLRKNSLEGSIPDTFYIGVSLQTFDVGHNRLTGKLPRSLQNCSSLDSIMFYGSISPPGQGPLGLPELRIFEISDNNFTGSLPPTYFVNWKASSLTMNENGHIPLSFSNLSNLESLDLSSNQLSWTIPNGPFLMDSVFGVHKCKARLCGLPLQETCFVTNAPPTQPPKQEGEEENEEVFSWKGVAIGYGPGVLLGLADIS
ncbi:hypothetical protein F2Q69_00017110 [Brassica cretica]|uniref:Leucine-rich repeat-containing N-terminal plant-type domain-containing protein n=1 Tax=Brassica cretica TaxID=69181 RepID=A0A8S9QQH7_BRACR|nr:hypothetical protein F2Q69_00017110 [Brassica cretica]